VTSHDNLSSNNVIENVVVTITLLLACISCYCFSRQRRRNRAFDCRYGVVGALCRQTTMMIWFGRLSRWNGGGVRWRWCRVLFVSRGTLTRDVGHELTPVLSTSPGTPSHRPPPDGSATENCSRPSKPMSSPRHPTAGQQERFRTAVLGNNYLRQVRKLCFQLCPFVYLPVCLLTGILKN